MHTHAWRDLIGAVVAERYTLRAILYSGRYQAEFVAVTSGPEQVEHQLSLTLVEPEPAEMEQELARIAAAGELQHPNLLGLLDCGRCVLLETQLLYVVTEVAETTLAQTLARGPLAEAEVRALLQDLLSGLEYIHGRQLVYRALEAETTVRAGGSWRLGDLGELHASGQFDSATAVNPARLRSTPPEAAAGWILPAGDVWALGVLLHDVAAEASGSAPPPFDAVIRGCAEPDPHKRLTLEGIRRVLAPAPAPEPEVAVGPSGRLEEPAEAKSRVFPLVLGGVAILCVVGFAALWLPRKSAPVPAHPAPQQPMATGVRPSAIPPGAGRPSPFTGQRPPAVGSTPPPAKTAPVTSVPVSSAPVHSTPVSPAPVSPAPVQPTAPTHAAPESGVTAAGQNWEIGQADYLSETLEGRPTASGEIFSSQAMCAAHRKLPLGTRLRVTNLANNRSVVVRVNDRGGYRRGFIVSVTRGAAEQLGFASAGSARVRIETMP